jgi:hypothetical protein
MRAVMPSGVIIRVSSWGLGCRVLLLWEGMRGRDRGVGIAPAPHGGGIRVLPQQPAAHHTGFRCSPSHTHSHVFPTHPRPTLFSNGADEKCRRAMTDVTYQTNSGRPIRLDAIYYENSGDKFIGKVTTLPFNLTNADGGVICWTLRDPCPTLRLFANPLTRDKGLFEVALYDRKVDNYEVR